jgi:gliding motility-associated protein GldM
MKAIYLFLSLVMLPCILTAQEVGKNAVVAATNMNVLYIGIRNPVEIAVPGITSDKITATVTNGTIAKTDGGWEVLPASTNESVITVFVDNKKVSEKIFRVKKLPAPTAFLAGINNGVISKDKILDVEALEVKLEDFVWNINYEIKSFNLLISEEGSDTELSSKGNALTKEMKSLIISLKRGQNFYIKDIKATGPDGRLRDLSPVIFVVY